MAVQTQTGKGAVKVEGEEKTEPLSTFMSTKRNSYCLYTAQLITPLVPFIPEFPTISKSPNLGFLVFLQYLVKTPLFLSQQNQNQV